MKAQAISLEKAKQDKLFYFVANVVPYRQEDGRCLILKRDMRETAHPGKWAVPGGKLEWKDLDLAHPSRDNGDVLDFEQAIEGLLRREAKEEAGIDIGREFVYINSMAYVRPDGIPVAFIKLGGKYEGGEVALEEGAFTDFAWVNAEEVKGYDCIEGVPREVEKTIAAFLR